MELSGPSIHRPLPLVSSHAEAARGPAQKAGPPRRSHGYHSMLSSRASSRFRHVPVVFDHTCGRPLRPVDPSPPAFGRISPEATSTSPFANAHVLGYQRPAFMLALLDHVFVR